MTAAKTVGKVAAKIKLFNECSRHWHPRLILYFVPSRASPQQNWAMWNIFSILSTQATVLDYQFIYIYSDMQEDYELFSFEKHQQLCYKLIYGFSPASGLCTWAYCSETAEFSWANVRDSASRQEPRGLQGCLAGSATQAAAWQGQLEARQLLWMGWWNPWVGRQPCFYTGKRNPKGECGTSKLLKEKSESVWLN